MSYNLENLSMLVIENIEEILSEFGIEYKRINDRISMRCPIHGGDNESALGILLKDVGHWQCFTHQCHEKYGNSIINFIHAILCIEKEISLSDAIKWCANKFGIEEDFLQNVKELNEKSDKTSFIQLIRYISKKSQTKSTFFPKELATTSLEIPSSYYINRGYSKDILKKFSIGDCYDDKRQLFLRAVFPCFCEHNEYVVGFIGRSLFEKCSTCGYYHNKQINCYSQEKITKWKSNTGFNADSYLYNLWGVDKSMDYVILVEGPGCCLRLEEAGIKNSIASFGTKFTDSQREIISSYGIRTIYLVMDNDEAGNKARLNIKNKCRRWFNIVDIELNGIKDIGDIQNLDDVKNLFRKVIK